FDGKSIIQQHRLVYQALDALMETEIHALSIQVK
ncbi:MAG TPA: BolA/IbaG family iron-sulfur metabolism protein, partial [Gammaproteobacteria bacterium]|nr:BolA/IbaG family iron-sulfur metabolism protein [Gammaproteobacteria bacterium]